jgi:hypothetical protein
MSAGMRPAPQRGCRLSSWREHRSRRAAKFRSLDPRVASRRVPRDALVPVVAVAGSRDHACQRACCAGRALRRGRGRSPPVCRWVSKFRAYLQGGRGRVGSLRQCRRRARSARLGRTVMNPKPIELAQNPLLAKGLPALRRARKRAEELAIRTNTALIQVVDGKVVRVYPTPNGQRQRRDAE